MMIFWLVLKLEISYQGSNILKEGFWFSLRGFFEDYIFTW
jgi:hypothetical protein